MTLTEQSVARSDTPNQVSGTWEVPSMAKSVSRSAKTGRFVSKSTVARWPGKTTTERVGSGTGNSRSVSRSASSGRFVTSSAAKRNPGGTINQQV